MNELINRDMNVLTFLHWLIITNIVLTVFEHLHCLTSKTQARTVDLQAIFIISLKIWFD